MKMKRIFGLVLALALVSTFAVGCGKKDKDDPKDNTAKYEAAFKTAGEAYFNKHMKGVIGQDFNNITLEMLETAGKNNSDENYNLADLAGCDKTSSVTIEADQNRNIVNYTYDLKCN